VIKALFISASTFSLLAASASLAAAPPPRAQPAPPSHAFDFVPPPAPLTPTSATLEAIHAKGKLECAVVAPQDDWNTVDIHGDLSAFETEICRGLAAAVLGDPDKASIQSFPGEPETVGALRSGQVQLAVGLSPSTGVAVAHGVTFGRPVFFDTVRVLTHKDSGIHDAAGLRNHLVCARDLSFAEMTLQDEMRARGQPLALQSHSEQGENDAAVAVRRCAAGAGMETRLAASRANFHGFTPNFVFLPERWGLSPMVVATRNSDPLWSLAVDGLIDALVEAEALGVTQANVARAGTREDIGARELTGRDIAVPRSLGLPRDWAVRAVAAVGNYGEIFDRTIGQPYHLDRGPNALWSSGGLMAPNPLH
jgi:general L-amino acid transport system substrate-binding protein